MLYFLIILVASSGYTSAHWLECDRYIPEELSNMSVPTKQELDSMCPGILKYLTCYGNEMEENPDDFSDSNIMFHYFLSLLTIDLCTYGTEMRTDYLDSVECFKNVQDKYNPCFEKAQTIYQEYKNASNSPIVSHQISLYDEKECFPRAHAIVCMAKHIWKTCGSLPHSTYIQLVSKSRYIYKYCHEEATIHDFMDKYMDYLKLDRDLRKKLFL